MNQHQIPDPPVHPIPVYERLGMSREQYLTDPWGAPRAPRPVLTDPKVLDALGALAGIAAALREVATSPDHQPDPAEAAHLLALLREVHTTALSTEHAVDQPSPLLFEVTAYHAERIAHALAHPVQGEE